MKKKVVLTPDQVRMKKGVAFLKKYMQTYDKQFSYLDYSNETFILDILYGLGVALDEEKYSFAQGFKEFRKFLKEFLKKNY